jgi:hypothetical protein
VTAAQRATAMAVAGAAAHRAEQPSTYHLPAHDRAVTSDTEHEWRPATAADIAAAHPSQIEWLRACGVDAAAPVAGEG